MNNNKRGQLTIFIVLGILLVAAVVMFFLFRGDIIQDVTKKPEKDIVGFLDSCLEDKIRIAIKDLSLHGGYIDSKLNINFTFDDEETRKITYLCYNQNYYLRCINQKPLFLKDIETNIHNYISEDVENCFNELTESFSSRDFKVDTNYRNFTVKLLPKRVIVQTDSDITMSAFEETTKEENFQIVIASKLFEISRLVQELVNSEAEFCYSENLGINLVYPEFSVDKFKTEGSIIYTVDHVDSKERFRFAVRGCVIPPGI
jgi:hypothetical protein